MSKTIPQRAPSAHTAKRRASATRPQLAPTEKTAQWRRRNSRLRVLGDTLFALVGLLLVSLLCLFGILAVLYWSKTDLGIDLFNAHLGEFFDAW
jgi:hypothetical protein